MAERRAAAPPHVFTFGSFELRCAEGLLLVAGQPAPLGRRAVDVLTALVLRRERLVSKSELLDLVWPGLVVEDNNLQVHVSALRKLLGPQLIATVPGRGYRFMAEAEGKAGAMAASTLATTGASVGAGQAGAYPAAAVTPPPASPGARLLLVDDHRVHRLLLARMLQLQGHEVASAENGLQALRMLHEGPYDLMLLDLDMPGMSGFELLQRLFDDLRWRDLPVIVTSALEGTANVARCIELGADDYLHKPVNPVLLKARVDASLSKNRQHEQQRQAAARFAGAAVAQDLAAGGFQNGGRRLSATVIACRIHGFAGLAEQLPAEEAFELLNTCYLLLFDAVGQHGGVVNQIVGAELTALFGAPLPLPDAPAAAARAARDAVEMIGLLNAERAGQGKAALRLAIGIASGEVVSGQAGTHQRATYACVGDPVHLAERLKERAAGGAHAVLVDGPTQAALTGLEAAMAGVAADAEASARR